MSTKFSQVLATRPRVDRTPAQITRTSIHRAIPGREDEMIRNTSGIMSFAVDCFTSLERFLILGTEGSTYYGTEQKHTIKMFDKLKECIEIDAERVVDMIANISVNGRAAKNDQALFCLAAVMKLAADPKDRYYARIAVNKVARIGTHILHLAEFVDQLGGWGSGTRKAFQNWFLEKEPAEIAYQAIKYGQRDGWSMRDILRKAHPWGTEEQNATFDIIAHPETKIEFGKHPPIMWAVREVKKDDVALEHKLNLVKAYNLPREVFPTEMLNSTVVWETLLPGMGPEAMMRNLGKMTSIGILGQLSDNSKFVRGVLTNKEELKRARIHPLKVLLALTTYKAGHGQKGKLSWTPNQQVVDALEECFELSFDFTEPCGKNVFISVDVSGSMRWSQSKIPGTEIYAADAAAVMAMVTAKKEPNYMITAFSSQLTVVDIQRSDSFSTAIQKFKRIPPGSTNLCAPMQYANANRIPIDCFQIYTDNDLTMGNMHPSEALKIYRRDQGRPAAKLAVVATVANEVSVADPKDSNMMDFAGFDANAPQAMAAFTKM